MLRYYSPRKMIRIYYNQAYLKGATITNQEKRSLNTEVTIVCVSPRFSSLCPTTVSLPSETPGISDTENGISQGFPNSFCAGTPSYKVRSNRRTLSLTASIRIKWTFYNSSTKIIKCIKYTKITQKVLQHTWWAFASGSRGPSGDLRGSTAPQFGKYWYKWTE